MSGFEGKARRFRALHEGSRAFVMPNVWDAGSARIVAGLGFVALATRAARARERSAVWTDR